MMMDDNVDDDDDIAKRAIMYDACHNVSNFDQRESILIIFGRNATETVNTVKVLYFSRHLASAYALRRGQRIRK